MGCAMDVGGLSLVRRIACVGVKATAWSLAVGCALAGLLAHGGRWSDWLDILTHFAPGWLGGGVAALVLAAGLWRWKPRPVLAALAAVATLASAALIAPEYLRPASPRGPATAARQLKVVQFNSRGNAGSDATAARWIVAQDPDIVVLEEVYPPIRDAILALRPYHVSPTVTDCPSCRVIVLSKAAPVEEGMRDGWLRRWRAAMARATFAEKDGGFTVVGAHLSWPIPAGPQQSGARQLAYIASHFDPSRLIVAGDFNSTPWSFTLRRFDRTLGLERRDRADFSWPVDRVTRFRLSAPFTFLPLDHVYAGSAWRTVKVERGPRGLGSDHLPIVVTLARADPR
jgi:endonuclease/exonuclease/phosphatase (EEP) superfamily protein YafD